MLTSPNFLVLGEASHLSSFYRVRFFPCTEHQATQKTPTRMEQKDGHSFGLAAASSPTSIADEAESSAKVPPKGRGNAGAELRGSFLA